MLEENCPLDAQKNWVYRTSPVIRPYLQLARLDRPIGIWLVLWPCLWSASIAYGIRMRALMEVAPQSAPQVIFSAQMGFFLLSLVLFFVGAVCVRGAGCTINDILDRNFDKRVKRTKGRPLASGVLSVRQALFFVVFQLFLAAYIVLFFNLSTFYLALAVLPLIAIYPIAKRYTSLPQVVLGFVFNWGVLLGWMAIAGHMSVVPFILYAGCIAWTIGYDTIYAFQDQEDDAFLGLKSTALLWGDKAIFWVALFYALFWISLVSIGLYLHLNPFFFVGIFFVLLHLSWQVMCIQAYSKHGNDEGFLRVFRSNARIGWLVCIVFFVGFFTP